MRTKRVSEVKQELVGVPAPYEFESPASWISRAALSQGIRVRELLDFFGMDREIDIDMGLTPRKSLIIASTCGLSERTFRFSTRMFASMRSLDQTGKNFLLPFSEKSSQYRYCPGCLHQQRVKHFPVHWRFKAWRCCPIHQCLMEERCPHCGSNIKLSADLMFSGPGRKGVAFLDRCLRCEKKLTAHWKMIKGLATYSLLSNEELHKLRVGRSVLSAIYYGYYVTWNSKRLEKKKLSGILGLMHFAGTDNDWIGIDNRELMRRRSELQKFSTGNNVF